MAGGRDLRLCGSATARGSGRPDASATTAAASDAAAFFVTRFGFAAGASTSAAGAASSAAAPSAGARFGFAMAAATGAARVLGEHLGCGSGSGAASAAAAFASATDTSLRMSIRQPVSRAASRAFWPSRPMASESIRSGHGHARDPVLLVDVDGDDLGRAQRVGHEHARVVAPRDDVDLLARQLGDDGLDAGAALADGGTDRVEALLARGDGDLGAAAGLAGDGLDLDGAAVDLGDLELEQALEEALVRPADEDLRALGRATDLEHERLDVLADPVVLERRLLGRGQDRLDVLADVEDDRARLDAVDRAGDELALAAGELVEDLVALDLADALQDDLLGGLRADPAEDVAVELLGLDEVADVGAALEGARLIDRSSR